MVVLIFIVRKKPVVLPAVVVHNEMDHVEITSLNPGFVVGI